MKKHNALIKSSGLLALMNKAGIERVSEEALSAFEETIEGNVRAALPAMKEEMFVQGRKTLKAEDVKAVLEKKEKSWEV
ncbi:MAG: histone [Nanoarchaeota archaeon]|nr:histone [Nanoarchaeota archaeon]